jgi:hypothetical protein
MKREPEVSWVFPKSKKLGALNRCQPPYRVADQVSTPCVCAYISPLASGNPGCLGHYPPWPNPTLNGSEQVGTKCHTGMSDHTSTTKKQ